ncbi:MAG: hypothetical protein HRT38_17100 [Alteromonadaceae bacterium]|nr:hypothetical protein [Alteromonadaceae bacterium]
MKDEDLILLEELENKTNLTPVESARLKIIRRAVLKDKPKFKKTNVFAIEATTNMNPVPIRFTQREKTGLIELRNDIKRNNPELIIMELGSERDISNTKLIRAAVHLLKEITHEEIIKAIKDIKLNMIR